MKWPFGSNAKKKRVAVFMFYKKGESYNECHAIFTLTKKEALKMVAHWWDCHGTAVNNFDAIQFHVLKEGER